jgi:hypothetical protein
VRINNLHTRVHLFFETQRYEEKLRLQTNFGSLFQFNP